MLGVLMVVIGGTSWLVALLLLLLLFFLAGFSLTGGLLLILFDCARWTCMVTQPVQRTPLWPASWLPAVGGSVGSGSVEVESLGDGDRLQFMTRQDALLLDEPLGAGEVSLAWLVWSDAAETAAFCSVEQDPWCWASSSCYPVCLSCCAGRWPW